MFEDAKSSAVGAMPGQTARDDFSSFDVHDFYSFLFASAVKHFLSLIQQLEPVGTTADLWATWPKELSAKE